MTILHPGQQLRPGQSLQSNNKLYTFTMQQDGNAVLYDRNSKPLWSTNTEGLVKPRDFIMQTDGNLVLYSTDGTAPWASNTSGNPGAFFNIQDDGNLVVYRAGSQSETPNNALWARTSKVGTPTGPAPGTTLGGNRNYVMANLSGNNGNALTGVQVVIDVTEDIESYIGIGFQLNAYSNAGALSAWQQYFIWQNVVSRSEVQIKGQIEPWPQSTAGTGNETTKFDLLNHSYVLATLGSMKIPKGYQFTVTLGTTAGNKVSSAQFRVVDNNGNVLYHKPPIQLVGLSLDDGKTTTVAATSRDLAEIIAFQLNVVGPINSRHAKMSSGAGIITYHVNDAMSANQNLPANKDSDWHTLEQTNSVYSALPQGKSRSFVQTFKAST
jgi:hypothetical protein